jgi:cytochrome c553
MTAKICLGVAITAALLGALALAPRAASADPPACGTTDNPCPLQKWMRGNMGTPLASGDMGSLGAAFDHVATLSPDPSWAVWAQAASAGSTAAKNKDSAGVKAACKTCHDAFKDKYKAQFLTRPAS